MQETFLTKDRFMTESKSMFMTVIFHLTNAGKYYFVLYQFTLYNMSDCRCEKPEAYKVICLVYEPMPVFFKKSDQECGLQLQYDRRITSTVHQGSKNIINL